jgi:DNA-binding transcriptional LysR family regulator
MIDLEAVVALRAVATDGSVVAAATTLGFTPSAISQQIKRLEREVGVALLERVGRGVVLTDAGTRLVVASTPSSTTSIASAQTCSSTGGSDRVTGEIRLAAFSTVVRGLVVPVIAGLRERHPQPLVAAARERTVETIALVASGQRDLGIVHRWGGVALAMPEHLVATPLFTDVADVILRRDHPLAGRAVLHPEDLAGRPGSRHSRRRSAAWLRRLFDGVPGAPRIAHESMEFENHVAFARAGGIVALRPRLGRGEARPGPRGDPDGGSRLDATCWPSTAARRATRRPCAPCSTTSSTRAFWLSARARRGFSGAVLPRARPSARPAGARRAPRRSRRG